MANTPQAKHPSQSFPDDEWLYHRVHRENLKSNGRPTLLAFTLPDMSVDREQFGSEEGARKGFRPEDWAVVAFLVRDIPPRQEWLHIAHTYRLLPRHVPVAGNFAHSEVRIWRTDGETEVLITTRVTEDFDDGDPDRECQCGHPDAYLDPDFHMRWRKRIALASKTVLPPTAQTA